MENLPQIIAAVASLVLAVATLVQVVRTRSEVTENTAKTVAAAEDAKSAADTTAETLGAVNGHGTAMEALTEAVAKGDQLVELNEYTHKSIHSLRNTITPMVAKVDQLWRDAGHADEPASSNKAGG